MHICRTPPTVVTYLQKSDFVLSCLGGGFFQISFLSPPSGIIVARKSSPRSPPRSICRPLWTLWCCSRSTGRSARIAAVAPRSQPCGCLGPDCSFCGPRSTSIGLDRSSFFAAFSSFSFSSSLLPSGRAFGYDFLSLWFFFLSFLFKERRFLRSPSHFSSMYCFTTD